jgi:predicted NBD/HSP70 family sugar kinase
MAEKSIGIAKDFDNILYLSCGMGLGSGLILNGSIYEGKNFSAGEIGYFTDSADAPGVTLEGKVKLDAVRELISRGAKDGLKGAAACRDGAEITFDSILREYKKGNSFLNTVFGSIGTELGAAVANIIALLNLELVILGGIYSEFSREILEAINKAGENSKLSRPVTAVSKLGLLGSVYGGFFVGVKAIVFSNG